MADFLQQEDGSSYLLQEDGSSKIILESSPGDVTPDFIASVSAVYAPTLVGLGFALGFIASTTVVHPPDHLWSTGSVETYDTTTSWLCPPDVFRIYVEAFGGGGGGGSGPGLTNQGHAGGGGGAYAAANVPVTPGTSYTITVGIGGGAEVNGGDSQFVGDSSTTVLAKGGQAGVRITKGTGGAASSSTGTTKHSGGDGGAGVDGPALAGAGGGESGSATGDGHVGGDAGSGFGLGGTGGPGGDGGNGGLYLNFGLPGTAPGGAGGGGGGNAAGGSGANGRVLITYESMLLGFIASSTTVYTPAVQDIIRPPFVASTTAVYTPTVTGPLTVTLPFIGSQTTVLAIAAVWMESTGAGNGGETFGITLAPSGSSVTATLAADIAALDTALELTGDGSLPSTPVCLTIDDEVLLVTRTSTGHYRIIQRRLSNTVGAAHTAGADATWTDSYDMAVVSTQTIAHNNLYESGLYDAWLIAFDCSQAYLSGDRYSTYVDQLVGVFPSGTGSAGSNRLDASQPSATHAPATTTDDCPVGMTRPARVVADIDVGDVALLRYTNTEAGDLVLGPRASSIQSWYGFMRVNSSNADVTTSDPTANIVDGTIDDEFYNEDFVTVTLPGSSRTFTHGGSPSPPNYNDRGWPLAALAVRQGTKRVPHWTSPDWHNFNYVYTGFGTDATFVQVLINRNGYFGDELTVALPGSQDIDGPNATWDDPAYYTSTAWYVGIIFAPVLLIGPTLNPPPPSPPPGVPPPAGGTIVPAVPPGGGSVVPPTPIEGGEGGGISPPVSPPAAGERFTASFV